MSGTADFDIIIVGGGLSGSLTAWRLAATAPGLRIALVEKGDRLGGNHTWSAFETDLEPAQNAWLDPLVSYRWPGYEVHFPKLSRSFPIPYRSIASERFHEVIEATLGDRIIANAVVTDVTASSVTFAGGRTLRAPCVIDARGQRESPHLALGFQKFLGQEVRFKRPHGRTVPIIMDARVPQNDGYRFVYTLPLAPDRMLIEDTYYSDDQALSLDALRDDIRVYAAGQGWEIAEMVREEIGVLPIILAGDIEALLAESAEGAPRIGLAAALFHPTTGYSLPDAVRLADRIAKVVPRSSDAARTVIAAYARETWSQRGFFRMLNRMLFRAGAPQQRYAVLQRFYGLDGLDGGLIRRFYSARPTFADQARVLIGKPPVPILAALACVSDWQMLQRHRGG